jgi:hypothetical protein
MEPIAPTKAIREVEVAKHLSSLMKSFVAVEATPLRQAVSENSTNFKNVKVN